jgi:hypothetical protein
MVETESDTRHEGTERHQNATEKHDSKQMSIAATYYIVFRHCGVATGRHRRVFLTATNYYHGANLREYKQVCTGIRKGEQKQAPVEAVAVGRPRTSLRTAKAWFRNQALQRYHHPLSAPDGATRPCLLPCAASVKQGNVIHCSRRTFSVSRARGLMP